MVPAGILFDATLVFCQKSLDVDHDKMARHSNRRPQLIEQNVKISNSKPRTANLSDLVGRLLTNVNADSIILLKKVFYDACKKIRLPEARSVSKV